MFAESAVDDSVPEDVFQALVTVLADWATGPGGWASGRSDAVQRPVGVVTLCSRSRPRLVESVGARLAAVGQIPLLGSMEWAGAPGHSRQSNSAQRVRELYEGLTVPPPLAEALSRSAGPVFLVDDFTDTGWTLAMAARLLRRQGASAVLPLVLAVQG